MGRPYISLFFIALVVLPGQTERVEVETSTLRHARRVGDTAVEDFLCGKGAVLKEIREITNGSGDKADALKKNFKKMGREFWANVQKTLEEGLGDLGRDKNKVERDLQYEREALKKITDNAHQEITAETVGKMFAKDICEAFDHTNTGGCPFKLTAIKATADNCEFAKAMISESDDFWDDLLESSGDDAQCEAHLDEWRSSIVTSGEPGHEGKAAKKFKQHATRVLTEAGLVLDKPMDVADGIFSKKCQGFFAGDDGDTTNYGAICDQYRMVLVDLMGRKAQDKSADPEKHKQAIKDNEALLLMYSKKTEECAAAIDEFSTIGTEIAKGVETMTEQEQFIDEIQGRLKKTESQLRRGTRNLKKLKLALAEMEEILTQKTEATKKAQEEVEGMKREIAAAIVALELQEKVVQETKEKLELVREVVNDFSFFKDTLSLLLNNLVQSYKKAVSQPVIDGGLTVEVNMAQNFEAAISDAKPALQNVAEKMHAYCQEGSEGGFDYAAARAVDAAGDAAGDVANVNDKGVEHMCKGMFDWTNIPDQLSAIVVAKQEKAKKDITSIQNYLKSPDNIGDLKDGIKERQDEGEPANLRNAIAIYGKGQSQLIQYVTQWRADSLPKKNAEGKTQYPMRRFGRLLRVFQKTSRVWKEVAEQLTSEQEKAIVCQKTLEGLQEKLPELETSLKAAIAEQKIAQGEKDEALEKVNTQIAQLTQWEETKAKSDKKMEKEKQVMDELDKTFEDNYDKAVNLAKEHDAKKMLD